MGLLRALPKIFLAVSVAAAALTASAARADDAQTNDEAHRHFKAGVAYLQDPDGVRFEDAYAEFKRAFDLSHSPKILGNLGLCAMKLERDGDAIAAYTRYLSEVADIEPEERAQITSDLQALTAGVVSVTITSSVPVATIVDTRLPVRGAAVTNFYDAAHPTILKVRPGRHLMVLREDGHDRARWEFSAEAGTSVSHDFVVLDEAPPAPAPHPQGTPTRAGPIAVITVGAAALVTGGVLGALTLSKVHSLDAQCPNDTCPGGVYPRNVDSARSLVRATDYMLLGGSLVTILGGTWWLVTMPQSSPVSKAVTAARFSGGCASRGCFASVGVGF